MGLETVALYSAIAGGVSAVAGGVNSAVQGHRARGDTRDAAKDKILDDKNAAIADQENIATGQTASVDAGNALKALGQTGTGASDTIGAGNTQKRSVIGG